MGQTDVCAFPCPYDLASAIWYECSMYYFLNYLFLSWSGPGCLSCVCHNTQPVPHYFLTGQPCVLTWQCPSSPTPSSCGAAVYVLIALIPNFLWTGQLCVHALQPFANSTLSPGGTIIYVHTTVSHYFCTFS